MKIPKTFKMKGAAWRVESPASLPHFRRGYALHEARLIQVAQGTAAGKPYSSKQRFETLLHEMLHAAIEDVAPEYNREKLVEPLARRLTEMFTTARFD